MCCTTVTQLQNEMRLERLCEKGVDKLNIMFVTVETMTKFDLEVHCYVKSDAK